jgi:hypothetical protein
MNGAHAKLIGPWKAHDRWMSAGLNGNASAALGRTTRECIQRSGLTGTYQIAVFAPSAKRIDPALGQNQPPAVLSQTFRLGPGVEIEWNVRLNRIRLISEGSGGGR